jgi:hypothetical protein
MIATCKRVLAIAGLVLAAGAWAQNYPDRPVKVIVPYQAGGAADTLIRFLGPRLSDLWGQPLVVENRAGASSIIGTEVAANRHRTAIPSAWPPTRRSSSSKPLKICPTTGSAILYQCRCWRRSARCWWCIRRPRNMGSDRAGEAKPGQLNYASMAPEARAPGGRLLKSWSWTSRMC